MKQFLHYVLLLSLPASSVAQIPFITAVEPRANARAVAPAGALTITSSQPLTAASAGALQVFSSQRGGRRTGAKPAVVSGATLSFLPGADAYRPGETVQYTVSTAAASAGGPLARPWVGNSLLRRAARAGAIFSPAPSRWWGLFPFG